MPELPDIAVYIEALEPRILGRTLERVRVGGPFLLRTTDPPIEETFGRKVTALRRIGKRIAIGLERGPWLVLHLMIAGRLHWTHDAKNSRWAPDAGGFRFRFGHAHAHRGRIAQTGVAARRRRGRIPRSRRHRSAHGAARSFRSDAQVSKSHPEARAHRSTNVQRNRQLLFG